MYLSFQDYQSLGGKLDEPAFVRYERLAAATVDRQTLRRLQKYAFEYVPTPPETEPPTEPETPPVEPTTDSSQLEVPEYLKNLMFDLVEYNTTAQSTDRMTASQSNNGVSVSYADADRAAVSARETELIRLFLQGVMDDDGVPILYTGVTV